MRKLLAPLLLLSFSYAAAQPLDTVDVKLPQIADSADQALTLPIFNGRIFYGHPVTNTHAFFAGPDWQNASVLYEGRWYTGLSVKYDLFLQELLVLHPSLNAIRLFSDRVQQFQLGSQHFVRIIGGKDSAIVTGFYQQLAEGEISIVALRKKEIEESIGDNYVIRTFVPVDLYYAIKDGKYYLVKNKKSLFALVKGQKGTIVKQLKREGIKYKQNKEAAIVRAAEIYNQSQH